MWGIRLFFVHMERGRAAGKTGSEVMGWRTNDSICNFIIQQNLCISWYILKYMKNIVTWRLRMQDRIYGV